MNTISFCKHRAHKVIDSIKMEKWSTDEVLISVYKIQPNTDDYLIKFTNSINYPDWYYLNRKDIINRKVQDNGSKGGKVYCVPLSSAKLFTPQKACEHLF